MVVEFQTIIDEAVDLQCDDFERRTKNIEFSFFTQMNNVYGNAIIDFNIAITNSTGPINITMKVNGVELQRYSSLSNEPVHSVREVFNTSGANMKTGPNTIQFEIIDTPLSETGQIRISDIVLWYNHV